MRLPWLMRTLEVGHYVSEVIHFALEVGRYASSGGSKLLAPTKHSSSFLLR